MGDGRHRPGEGREASGAGRELRARDILAGLAAKRLGSTLRVTGRVGSTNEEIKALAERGAADGTVLVAAEQSAGRGRRGRSWASPPGGLYLSVLLRPRPTPDDYPAALQFAAGIAVAEAAASCLGADVVPELVWPNDCWCGGRKLAGVLVETERMGGRWGAFVCGIGMNVDQRVEDFPPELRRRATSLRSLAGRRFDPAALAATLLTRLEAWDDVARGDGLPPVLARWCELAPSSQGCWVEIETASGRLRGVTAGVDHGGALQVDAGGGRVAVGVGDLVRLTRCSRRGSEPVSVIASDR